MFLLVVTICFFLRHQILILTALTGKTSPKAETLDKKYLTDLNKGFS